MAGKRKTKKRKKTSKPKTEAVASLVFSDDEVFVTDVEEYPLTQDTEELSSKGPDFSDSDDFIEGQSETVAKVDTDKDTEDESVKTDTSTDKVKDDESKDDESKDSSDSKKESSSKDSNSDSKSDKDSDKDSSSEDFSTDFSSSEKSDNADTSKAKAKDKTDSDAKVNKGTDSDSSTKLVAPAQNSGRKTAGMAAGALSGIKSMANAGETAQRLRARKVRRVVRHIDPWSVLTFGAIFHIVFFGALFISALVLITVASWFGLVANFESYIETLTGAALFEIQLWPLAQALAVVSTLMILLGTMTWVMLAVIFNLISDLVGGIRLTVVEEETGKPIRLQSDPSE